MNDLGNNIRNAYALLMTIIVAILLLTRSCGDITVLPKDRPEVIDVKTLTELFHSEISDTSTTDTIILKEFKNVPVYIHDTILEPLHEDSPPTDTFVSLIEDTLLEATITVLSDSRPYVNFSYKMRNFNTVITNTIQDSSHTTVTQKVRVNQVYLGPEAIIYPGFKGGFVTADFISKKGWQVEAGLGYGDFGEGFSPMIKAAWKPLITFRPRK